MWVQVRTFDAKKQVRVDGLSKLSKIEELREILVDLFDGASPDRQRLFYRGKQVRILMYADNSINQMHERSSLSYSGCPHYAATNMGIVCI